jgi:hypothetical protein
MCLHVETSDRTFVVVGFTKDGKEFKFKEESKYSLLTRGWKLDTNSTERNQESPN